MAGVSTGTIWPAEQTQTCTNRWLCIRRALTKKEEDEIKKLIKPMKKVKTEDEWNQKYQEGFDTLVDDHDYVVVEEFNERVQEEKKSMKFKKTVPAEDQAEDEESKEEQEFTEWFALRVQ